MLHLEDICKIVVSETLYLRTKDRRTYSRHASNNIHLVASPEYIESFLTIRPVNEGLMDI